MSPLLLAVVATPFYFLANALAATPGDGWVLCALQYSTGFLLAYGYGCWLITRRELKVPIGQECMAFGCALAGALMFVQSLEQQASELPGWAYALTPVALAVIFYPLVIAARALRVREKATGHTKSLGAVTAFIWFFADRLDCTSFTSASGRPERQAERPQRRPNVCVQPSGAFPSGQFSPLAATGHPRTCPWGRIPPGGYRQGIYTVRQSGLSSRRAAAPSGGTLSPALTTTPAGDRAWRASLMSLLDDVDQWVACPRYHLE